MSGDAPSQHPGETSAVARLGFALITADSTERHISRAVADETPVAIELNGIGYAVLMASRNGLEDLAVGFAWSERSRAARRS